MKFRFLAAAVPLLTAVALAAATGADGPVLPETIYPQLDAILKRAVQQSPRMLNRNLDLEIAENNRVAARSNLLPGVGGGYSYYQASDDRADLSGRVNVKKAYYNFSVTQPLFYWGERRNAARIGEIQQKIAEGNYRDGYRLLAQEIRGQFLQLIIRRTYVERSRLGQKYTAGLLKDAEDRFAKKVISDAEIFNVRVNAERAQIDLERNTFDYESARLALARLTGMDQFDDSALPEEIAEVAPAPGAIDRTLAGFLSQKEPPTPGAVNLRSQIEIENLNYASAQTRLRPKFNLIVGTSQDEQSYSLNVAQKYRVSSYFGGLSMSWTIFDGFASGASIRNALARRRQVENDYRALTTQLARDAQAQAKQVDFSARMMALTTRVLVATNGGFQVKKAEFARGAVSENDVTQTNLGYYDALISAQTARFDYLMKVGEFLGTVAEDPVLANVPTGR